MKDKNKQALHFGQAWEICGQVYWYIGRDPTDLNAHVFACGNYCYESWQKSLEDGLGKRRPELDKAALQPKQHVCDEKCGGAINFRHCEIAMGRQPKPSFIKEV